MKTQDVTGPQRKVNLAGQVALLYGHVYRGINRGFIAEVRLRYNTGDEIIVRTSETLWTTEADAKLWAQCQLDNSGVSPLEGI